MDEWSTLVDILRMCMSLPVRRSHYWTGSHALSGIGKFLIEKNSFFYRKWRYTGNATLSVCDIIIWPKVTLYQKYLTSGLKILLFRLHTTSETHHFRVGNLALGLKTFIQKYLLRLEVSIIQKAFSDSKVAY